MPQFNGKQGVAANPSTATNLRCPRNGKRSGLGASSGLSFVHTATGPA